MGRTGLNVKFSIKVSEGTNINFLKEVKKEKIFEKTTKRFENTIDNFTNIEEGSKGWDNIWGYFQGFKKKIQMTMIKDTNPQDLDEPEWFSEGEMAGRVKKRTTKYSKKNRNYNPEQPQFSDFLNHIDSGELYSSIALYHEFENGRKFSRKTFWFGYEDSAKHGWAFEVGTKTLPSYPLVRRAWRDTQGEFKKEVFEAISINFTDLFTN